MTVSKKTQKKKHFNFLYFWIGLFILIALVIGFAAQRLPKFNAQAAVLSGVGFVSDSTTDEYRANDNRGGVYGTTTLNWMELLTKYRGLNTGAWGNWGEPRRSGYEYNWSRSGATSGSALQNGQPAGLAGQISTGTVTLAYYSLGANDYAWYNPQFGQIYWGTLANVDLDNYISLVATNIISGVDQLNASGVANVLVSTIPDITMSPSVQVQYPDATRRQLVSDAISRTNEIIKTSLVARGIPYLDQNLLAMEMLSRVDAQGNITVGGEAISFINPGDEPHHGILADTVHSGTVMSGLYANYWIDVVNQKFGAGLTKFTDAELLQFAGIGQPPTSTPSPIIAPTATPTLTPPTPTNAPLPTSTPTPIPTLIPTSTPPTQNATTSKQIQNGSDDVNEDTTGFKTNSTRVWIGNGKGASYAGLRFIGLNIPKNAQIVSAKLETYNAVEAWLPINFRIFAHANDNSATFSTSMKPSTRVLTVSFVTHQSNEKWLANTWIKLADITPVIQELVNRSGWSSQSPVTLIIRGMGSDYARKYQAARETAELKSAKLTVVYR